MVAEKVEHLCFSETGQQQTTPNTKDTAGTAGTRKPETPKNNKTRNKFRNKKTPKTDLAAGESNFERCSRNRRHKINPRKPGR